MYPMHRIVCHYIHNKCWRPTIQHTLTLVTPIMSMSPSTAAITCYNFTHSTVAPPLPHPPTLTLDVPVHDAQ